jgi:hypothetical protein
VFLVLRDSENDKPKINRVIRINRLYTQLQIELKCQTENRFMITRQIFLVLVLLTIILLDSQILFAQTKPCKDTEVVPRRSISRFDKMKHLGIDYSQVTQFKLISRKQTYRIGEMIDLDLAIFNNSRTNLFIRRYLGFHIDLEVRDEKGGVVRITSYEVSLEGVTSDGYTLLEPASLINWTYQLYAGCDGTEEIKKYWAARKALFDDLNKGGLEYDKERFDRDLFVNFGLACLYIEKPGVYIITAAASNEYVVVSPCEGNPKTVVGKITSAPLKITIAP